MARVFISYARDDRDLAERLVAGLRATDHTVWWDRRLVGGDVFTTVIEAELKRADVLIVIWTKTSVASDWVLAEAERGRQGKKLIPVLFHSPPDFEVPLPFDRLNFVDLTTWDGSPTAPHMEGLDRAISAVQAGRYSEAIAALTGKALHSVVGGNKALQDLVAAGSTLGGLPLNRYVGGVLAVSGTAAALQAVIEALWSADTSSRTLEVGFTALVLTAIARACAQFVQLSRGQRPKVFFDNGFSFWIMLSLLFGVILFTFPVDGMAVPDNLAASLLWVFGVLVTVYVVRTFVGLFRLLARRL